VIGVSTIDDGGATAMMTDELAARDGWSRERLHEFQSDRVREVVAHAVARSPYYRGVLGDAALAPDVRLQDLPTLSKATLMEQFDRVVTDAGLTLDAVEAHARGGDPGALLLGDYHVFATSGTTGRRGVFPQRTWEFRQWVAAALHTLGRLGITPGTRTVGIPAPTPLHITQKLFTALGGFGGGRPALTATTAIAELVRGLNLDRPEALITLPSLAGALAAEQTAGRLTVDLHRVVVAGEALSDDVRARVTEAWGAAPFEIYGTTEALIVAAESPDRVGLHLTEDLVVVEVVDEHDRPVPDGQPGYKVLLTSLVNRALPLIRYELADSVTVAAGADPSRRPYRRLERVDGRSDDHLTLPGTAGEPVVVAPQHLRAPFASLAAVLQYQIVQEPTRLVVRVVLRPDAAASVSDTVAGNIRRALEAAGAVVPPLIIEHVPEIEREPGGAKLKLVKARLR
jgi:phenylacetate-CoA ligase